MSVYLKLKPILTISMLLSFPNTESTLRIASLSFSRTVSFLKNTEIEPCCTSGTTSQIRQEFCLCFSLSHFFSPKVINLPDLKAFHVLVHSSHWNYSQNVSQSSPVTSSSSFLQHIPLVNFSFVP